MKKPNTLPAVGDTITAWLPRQLEYAPTSGQRPFADLSDLTRREAVVVAIEGDAVSVRTSDDQHGASYRVPLAHLGEEAPNQT